MNLPLHYTRLPHSVATAFVKRSSPCGLSSVPVRVAICSKGVSYSLRASRLKSSKSFHLTDARVPAGD